MRRCGTLSRLRCTSSSASTQSSFHVNDGGITVATNPISSDASWTRDYLQQILTARVYDVAVETPLDDAPILSSRLGHTLMLKREDTQPHVFSFKLRGAYNKMAQLNDAQRHGGVVAASAGNHAQGVALAASRLCIDARIVMPASTPHIKVSSVRRLGGEHVNVMLYGDSFAEAQLEALRLCHQENRTFVPAFDDPLVIAGQGTIGMELVKQRTGRALDAVFVAVGGGGLIAGVGAYMKQVRPNVKIIGVEAVDAAAMTLSIQQQRRVQLDHVGLFADGAAVKQVGVHTFALALHVVDEMVTVTTDEICTAIKDGFTETRCIFEPAGALAIAGACKYARNQQGRRQTFVAVTSGANMDFNTLRFITERADESEALLSVKIPEQRGSFLRLYDCIYPRNVTAFSYRYASHHQAHICMSIRVASTHDVVTLIDKLAAQHMIARDLTNNEMAKVHARYLIGGRACRRADHELVYAFEFPERPGALGQFLRALSSRWNVSLFHYRNHGGDIGRVLVGLQVPPHDSALFQQFLNQLGYAFVNETDNVAYNDFLL